jgi:hypothetical protein
MVETQFLHSIAEVSATFVAIIAGFYTTKIISLLNDKRRILQRINTLDIEIRTKDYYLERMKKMESDTTNREDTEFIDDFIKYVRSEFFIYERIFSFEDLRKFFHELYELPITKNQERILRDKTPSLLEELEKKRMERKESGTTGTIFNPHPETPARSIEIALSNQAQSNRLIELREKIEQLREEISFSSPAITKQRYFIRFCNLSYKIN